MAQTWRWWPVAALAGMWLLQSCGAAWADKATADHTKLAATLKDIHNQGAKLFNAGDPAAAYYLFQGALQAIEPVLSTRPDVQKSIDEGLKRAKGQPSLRERAWVLHELIEAVREHLRPGGPGSTTKEPPVAPAVPNKPRIPVPAATLWHELGEQKRVTKIVDDFIALAAKDSKVNFTRNGKSPLTEAQLNRLKQQLVALISDASGGPLHYSGKSMREAHRGMAITSAEFDALAADLKQALQENHVPEVAARKLLVAIERTRQDIVERPAVTSPPAAKKAVSQQH